MKNRLILKLTLGSVIAIFAVSVFSTPVFAWGSATHTYLAKKLGNKYGIMNLQEMYGSVLPDMFNLMFGYTHQEYLWTETHYEFTKVVEKAKFGRRKAFAYGFASHNEAWGADYTAHIEALTIGSGDKGYVIIKKEILAPFLEPQIKAFLDGNGIPYPPKLLEELALSFADSGIETAVDLLVSQNEDKAVGYRMLISAKYRSLFVPFLLSGAYAKDFAQEAEITPLEAIIIITKAEKEFRKYMELYGGILTQENAIDLMAEQGAELAEMKLEKEYGITVDVPAELMKECLVGAITVVKGDYSSELAATLEYVDEQLKDHGVKTYSR